VRQQLYLLALFASLGTIGAVALNPKLIDQCAAKLGYTRDTAKAERSLVSGDTRELERYLPKLPSELPETPPSPLTADAFLIAEQQPQDNTFPTEQPTPPFASNGFSEPPPLPESFPEPMPEPPTVAEIPSSPFDSVTVAPPINQPINPIVPIEPAPPVASPYEPQPTNVTDNPPRIVPLPPIVIDNSTPPQPASVPVTPIEQYASPFASAEPVMVTPPTTIEHIQSLPPQPQPIPQTIIQPPVAEQTPFVNNTFEQNPFGQTLPVASNEQPASLQDANAFTNNNPTTNYTPYTPANEPQPQPFQIAMNPTSHPLNVSPPRNNPPAALVTPSNEPQLQATPATVTELVPCTGAETVAIVGTQYILMCDVLPSAKRGVILTVRQLPEEEQKKIPKEEIENAIAQHYKMYLEEQILTALWYSSFLEGRAREEVAMHEKSYQDNFDRDYINRLMKDVGANDIVELKHKLQSDFGSSLERERLLFVRRHIAMTWQMMSVRTAEGDCSYDEMHEYYNTHKAEFEVRGRAQWEELSVSKTKYATEAEAWNKIAWMGNQVAGGAPFDVVAKQHSHGLTAHNGGFRDWIKRGDLMSRELEDAIFTQNIGEMGKIITTSDGFYIVRVTKREEDRMIPFVEAQITIRDKVKEERRKRYEQETVESLRKRYPVVILKQSLNF
jgi:hypothetical protein